MKLRIELTLRIVRTVNINTPIGAGQRIAIRAAIANFITSIKATFPGLMKIEDWDGNSDAEIVSVRRMPCRWDDTQADRDYVDPLRADMDSEPLNV